MKRLEDLTGGDLDQFPIWTLAGIQKNEVVPWTQPGGAPLLSVVRAECVAADGSIYPGFGLLTKLNLAAPVVLAGGRQIKLFHGFDPPSDEFRAKAYMAVGKSAEEFFPIQIRCNVESEFRPPPVTYEGFSTVPRIADSRRSDEYRFPAHRRTSPSASGSQFVRADGILDRGRFFPA